MKVKNVNLVYNVLNYSWNEHKVESYNVLTHLNLEKVHKKILKKEISNYTELKEYLKREFMYHFWCKAEYELLVGALLCREEDLERIDVYRQIEMNLDLIVKYIIDEMEIKW